MKAWQILFLIVIATGPLVSCSKEDGDVQREPEKAAETAPQRAGTRTVEGILEYYPQDVKSVQAWIGSEFMVGETPIRPTETVPAETLRKMVGRSVRIEGVWNSGEKWEQPKPTDDESYLQNPSFSGGETVIRGSGIDAASILDVDK